MPQSLSGLRVLDLSRLVPGPFCSLILADLGAEVIRVESHLVGDHLRLTAPRLGGESCYFLSLNRNKKSLAVNLKRSEGREVFLKLASTADVIIEGFRPGQAESLGIGYTQVKATNPGIVFCSLSGYGQEGPFRDRPGHDLNYVALAGLLDLFGSASGGAFVPPLQIADLAGALFAAVGILSALVARGTTGEGGYVDSSLFHSAFSLLSFSAASHMSPQTPKENGQRYLMGSYPCYHLYATKDGRYMSVAALEPVFWADFCRAVEREDWIAKQFAVGADCAEVIAEVEQVFATRTRAEWAAFFRDRAVACEPVNTLEEALSGPPVLHHGLVDVDHPTAGRLVQIGSPFPDGGPRPTASPPPLLGQHTVEILRSLGYDECAIQQLRARRIVSAAEDVTAARKGRG